IPMNPSRLLKNSRGPRCGRRRAGCEEGRGRRCGTSATSRDDGDGPAPPQPVGQPGLARASSVARRPRWSRIAPSSRLAGDGQILAARPTRVFQQPARVFAWAFLGLLAILSPAPAQEGRSGAGRGSGAGGVRGPAQKHLIYVTLPGTLEGSWDQNGNGIVVLDANNNYSFVKRIPTWDVPASRNPEQVAGVTASPVTQMIYVATRGRLGAWDLTTEKKAWENAFDGQCCERPQISPDGKFMYVGSDLKDFWYVVNPRTGELITKVVSPLSPGAHNLNLSLDGKTAFMSPNGK